MGTERKNGPAKDSALRRRTVTAFRKWLKAHKVHVRALCHVYPRCYVLAKLAPGAVLVARPPHDDEVQIKRLPGQFRYPVTTIHEGDLAALTTGDWCACAYVSTATSGVPYVIPAVE